MAIQCCKDCVPPKRYPGCHDHCEIYKKAKELHEELKRIDREKSHFSVYAQRQENVLKANKRRGGR